MMSTAGGARPVSKTRPRCSCFLMFSLPKPEASASAMARRNGSCASLTACRYFVKRMSSKLPWSVLRMRTVRRAAVGASGTGAIA